MKVDSWNIPLGREDNGQSRVRITIVSAQNRTNRRVLYNLTPRVTDDKAIADPAWKWTERSD